MPGYRQIVIAFLLSLTVCSCHETVESKSYLHGYYEIKGVEYSEESLKIGQSEYLLVHMRPDSISVVATVFDLDKSLYSHYSNLFLDVDYKTYHVEMHTPEYVLYDRSYPVDEFAISVSASAVGIDRIRYVSLSALPYIHSGYLGFDFDKETLSDFFYSVYPLQDGYGVRPFYPVDKWIDDVNGEDLLLPGGGVPLSKSFLSYIGTVIIPKSDNGGSVEIKLTSKTGKSFIKEIEFEI